MLSPASPNDTIDRVFISIATRLDPLKFQVFFFSKPRNCEYQSSIMKPTALFQTEHARHVMAKAFIKLAHTDIDVMLTRMDLRSAFLIPWIKATHLRIKNVHRFAGPHARTHKKYYYAVKFFTRVADVVVVNSIHSKNWLKRFYGVNSIVIYNGVDADLFRPKEHHNNRLRILYVGQFSKMKNPLCVTRMATLFPQCDFIMVGDGPLKQTLLDAAKKLKNLYVRNYVPHRKLANIYSFSDIFLFPSLSEGFSNVLLEAAASGLPIVGFNLSSLPESVDHGVSGFLSNNEDEMREYLTQLIEDEKLRATFSKNARRRALRFSWDVHAKQYAELFETIVA